MVFSRRRGPAGWKVVLPHALTSGNLFCGFLALVLMVQGHPEAVPALLVFAALFDVLDGKVARLLGGSSAFGAELDSLADVVSFGVVPALFAFRTWAAPGWTLVSALAGSGFAICGALRLARFNLAPACRDGRFTGLPIPAAGLFAVSLAASAGPSMPAWSGCLAMGLLGALMVSTVPFGSLKTAPGQRLGRCRLATVTGLLLVSAETAGVSETASAALGFYILAGLAGFDVLSFLKEASRQGKASD